MKILSKYVGAIMTVGLLAGCGGPDGATFDDSANSLEPSAEIEGGVDQSQSALIASCFDWNGTCTGLPEGASCGVNGTCVAEPYGVSGWCHCYVPPPQAICPGSAPCGGHPYYSSCVKPTGGAGSCIPGQFGKGSGTSCRCF